MSIISVGYQYQFNQETVEQIYQSIGKVHPVFNKEKYPIEPQIYGGVWYGNNTRHITNDSILKDTELERWFSSRKTNVSSMYLRSVFISNKILVGVFSRGQDICFLVMSNQTKGTSTTLHKKACNSGAYGPEIKIDRIEVNVSAYIDRK